MTGPPIHCLSCNSVTLSQPKWVSTRDGQFMERRVDCFTCGRETVLVTISYADYKELQKNVRRAKSQRYWWNRRGSDRGAL